MESNDIWKGSYFLKAFIGVKILKKNGKINLLGVEDFSEYKLNKSALDATGITCSEPV